MRTGIRAVVTFESTAFNTSLPRDYFINPCCFGDDLAIWLIDQLRRRRYEPESKPGQEDFGWYLNFQVSGFNHCLVIGYRPGEDSEKGVWICMLERNRGFIASILGGRNREIHPEAAQIIHEILSKAPQISDVKWHFKDEFDSLREDLGTPSP
jgi:hypothetical protein